MGTFSTFLPPKSSHVDKHVGQNFFPPSNLVIRFHPGKLGTKPVTLTRRWDVYPKEGNSNYATVNPQNYQPVFTSKQLASSLRATSLVVPVLRGSLIMDTEGSIRTSSLTCEMTPLPQNTLTTSCSQIPSGPSIQMVYYDILDTYTSRKPGIYNYMFFSTCTTIPSQDTLARRRPFMPYVCITTGRDFKPTSRITANCCHESKYSLPSLLFSTIFYLFYLH